MTECGSCGNTILCPEHHDESIDKYNNDDPRGIGLFYSCGACVREYGTAIGSILHACESPLPMPSDTNDERREKMDAMHEGLERFLEGD